MKSLQQNTPLKQLWLPQAKNRLAVLTLTRKAIPWKVQWTDTKALSGAWEDPRGIFLFQNAMVSVLNLRPYIYAKKVHPHQQFV